MRITYRHGVETWDGSVTQEGDLRVTGQVGPLPVVGFLSVELLVHPWEALPGAICAVPFTVVYPVQCEARLVVMDEEIHVDIDSRLGFLEPILKPLVKCFLGSGGWQVTPAPGRPGE